MSSSVGLQLHAAVLSQNNHLLNVVAQRLWCWTAGQKSVGLIPGHTQLPLLGPYKPLNLLYG